MSRDPYTLCWDEDATLLVADVSWDALQAALRGLGVAVEVGGPADDRLTAGGPVLRPGGTTVLAGDLDGRAYVYARTAFEIVEPDLVAALAARTGGLVLGYSFQDNLGLVAVIAALGFVPEGADGWLPRGTKWDAWLDAPFPDARPEAHAPLYFGPLRQRVAALEEALDDEFGP